jgi:CPA2 family monovalent cation:H+ antiporter-2
MDSSAIHIPIPYLVETVAFLLTVVLVVPLCHRIKLSPILGYLAVGIVIGPHALSIVSDIESVSHISELGVVFLLFTIGLELSFERLKAYRKLIFGLGAIHVLLCATVIGLVAFAWGNNPVVSLLIGLCLALSSTAMVMQLLNERGEMASTHGRASLSVLLFQDLAVVPILVLLPILAAEADVPIFTTLGLAVLKAVVVVVVIVLLGRLIFARVFHVVARTKNVDVFTAMILLSVLATSLLTAYAGLSLTLGALLAGLLLAETEFRHQVEGEILPFKGLLLGMFFMSVGMMLDFSLVVDKAGLLALALVGMVAIKAVIGVLLARYFGLSTQNALRTGLYLSEAGEFAFVLIGQAVTVYKLIPTDVGQFMVILAGLSMVITPLLVYLAGTLAAKFAPSEAHLSVPDGAEKDLSNHVIIAGYGRVGKSVAATLKLNEIDYVALDLDSENVRQSRETAEPIYYGDAARPDILRQVGADNAKMVLITLDQIEVAIQVVEAIKRRWPDLPVLVRAHDTQHSDELYAVGADAVMPETLEASLQLATMVLQRVGVSPEQVTQTLHYMHENQHQDVHHL